MKLDDDANRTLSMQFDLTHSPAKVWRTLTEPALVARWLLPIIGQPGGHADTLEHRLEPGATFTLQAPAQAGWDGVVRCRYLAIEPKTRISWAWVVGAIDTVVTFTLEATDTGTRLSLEQTGFAPDQGQNLGGARYGWKMMTGKLVELLPTLPEPPKAAR